MKPTSTISIQDNIILPCGININNRIVKTAMSEGLGDEYSMPTYKHKNLYSVG